MRKQLIGVLGKDLFDFHRPQTNTKVAFGASAYFPRPRHILQAADVHMKWWYVCISAEHLNHKQSDKIQKAGGVCPRPFVLWIFWTYFASGLLMVAVAQHAKMPK